VILNLSVVSPQLLSRHSRLHILSRSLLIFLPSFAGFIRTPAKSRLAYSYSAKSRLAYSYSLQVFAHLTHVKNSVSGSSAALVCSERKYARLCPHFGQSASATGIVEVCDSTATTRSKLFGFSTILASAPFCLCPQDIQTENTFIFSFFGINKLSHLGQNSISSAN